MINLRRVFSLGRLNKDITDVELQNGEYRDALNVDVVFSEGSDQGSVEKSWSNIRKTNLALGANPITLDGFADEFRDKLYWLVKSDTGCFLIEYDAESESAVFVLQDTRALATRVFNLNEDYLVTGIQKIISETVEGDLLLITNDDIEPLCINIERAKLYGENGFQKEDIYLIKKPPRFAPDATLVYTSDLTNNIEEKFLLFAYRYKYLDKEYSALSSFTNYKFTPKPYELDFSTNENLGMVNAFNGVRLSFDTGDKRVTDIQIVVKESNSNVLYIIENFNKEDEGWDNLETKTVTYSNNKVYVALPESEILRSFDNVPRKAKSLSIVGNRAIFGNYVEGYNLIDINLNKIKIDFQVSLIARPLDQSEAFVISIEQFSDRSELVVDNTALLELTTDKRILVFINIKQEITSTPVFANSYFYVIPEDFANLQDLFLSDDFQSFIATVNTDFQNNLNFEDLDPDWTLTTSPVITATSASANTGKIIVSKATFTDELDATHDIVLEFVEDSAVSLSDLSTNASLKTNRDYEVAIIYLDEFGRKTIALASLNNTLYIQQAYSAHQNRLKLTVNNRPPLWADRYKIVVKSQALTYETIAVTVFYNEDSYVWCKLEGDGKDKVKENDVLIVKRTANGIQSNILKVKVLEIKAQEKNFITGNFDEDENEIFEEAATYMRIKPTGFSMGIAKSQIYQDDGSGSSLTSKPVGRMDLFTQLDDLDVVIGELAIPQGSSIFLRFASSRFYDDGEKTNIYEKTHYAQRDYDTLEEWFNDNILDRPLFGNEGNDPQNYQDGLEIVRGIPFGNNGVTEDPAGQLFLMVTGTYSGGTSRSGRIDFEILIRTVEGVFIFETDTQKLTDVGLFYESEETFEIIDGNHQGNLVNQNAASFVPAEIELSFFNCFAQGNGVESYKIKDSFNKPYLNIDMRPTTTSIEKYREIRRYADLTYSEPFIESSNINGLNEFNLSRANYKELEKGNGSIQITVARDNDIAVFQEEKTGVVLFGKDAIYSGDGTYTLSAIPQVLGDYIPYAGKNGISRNPESLAVNDKRIYYTNSNRGTVIRLSVDGITEIIYGMTSYFRTLFGQRKKAKKLGGFDPYKRQYILTVEDEPVPLLQLNCDNTLNKFNQTAPFSYELKLNGLGGNIIIGYNITEGNATITAVFDGDSYVVSNVTGSGNLSFERTSLVENIVVVTIIPVTPSISYSIMNICPFGSPMKIVTILLGDEQDEATTVLNRFRWGSSSLYNYNDLFGADPVSRFTEEVGIEGTGKFPLNGSIVNMQSYTDGTYTGAFRLSECNRMGYLVTDVEYASADIETILAAATFITATTTGEEDIAETTSGSFLFNRFDTDEILYMIWDYTSRNPVLNNDSATVSLGESVIIDVLANDEPEVDPVVTISVAPLYGTAVVNIDNTITYTHDGTENFNDVFTYMVTVGSCSSTAQVTIEIGAECGGGITAAGGTGVYETIINTGTEIGWFGLEYNAQGVPDRFSIYWNDVLMADSKYVGDGLTLGVPTGYTGLLGGHSGLNKYQYNGTMFVLTGTGTESFTVIQDDIADRVTQPSNGTGTIMFFKSSPTPTAVKILSPNPLEGTAWSINTICPVPEIELTTGVYKLVYGFLPDADKTITVGKRSIGVWFDEVGGKFYVNAFGRDTFSGEIGDPNYWSFWSSGDGVTADNRFINDGVTWWEISTDGTILSTGII